MIGRVIDGFAAAWLALLVLGTTTAFTVQQDLVIPRLCMKAVALTAQTECHGPDKEHLRCTGLVLTVKPGCEQLRVGK